MAQEIVGGKKGDQKSKRKADLRSCRRKAHHHFMAVTCSDLKPGINYHLRIAGINRVGQGGYSLPTYSTRTRAVPPGVCPSPRASAIFLTAITVAWSDGNDGGSSITAFVVRFSGGEETDEVRCGRTKWCHHFEGLRKGRPYSFQVRAGNNEGFGPWSAPSNPIWTLTRRPDPPPAPRLAFSRPPPGPLSLWLSIVLPKDDGGDPISAVLLERREHSGARAPEWSRCERLPVLPQTGGHHCFTGSATSNSLDLDGAASLEGAAVGGNSVSSYTPDERSGSTAKFLGTQAITVLVDGLKPRTHYSFRASAVNSQGAGDAGPPCRRVRTSPPRPPSWSTIGTANFPAKKTLNEAEWEDHQAGEEPGLALSPRPRAIYCGHGACSVAWEEPFCNGAPIESYEVEFARLGAVVAVETAVGASPALIAPENLQNRNDTSLGLQPATMTMEPLPQPQPIQQPPRASVARVGLREEAREIMETAVRTVDAHMRVASIKGLVAYGEYTFRVAGVNIVGKGEGGPWSAIVRIADPND